MLLQLNLLAVDFRGHPRNERKKIPLVEIHVETEIVQAQTFSNSLGESVWCQATRLPDRHSSHGASPTKF